MAQTKIVCIVYIFPDPVQAGQFAVVGIQCGNSIARIVTLISQVVMKGTADLKRDVDRIFRRSKRYMGHCIDRYRHLAPHLFAVYFCAVFYYIIDSEKKRYKIGI